jgi:hypothetical protein
MNDLAKRTTQMTGDILPGHVRSVGPAGELVVRAGEFDLAARAAASCLVAPEQGDRVLVSVIGRECFVLAVLERAAETPTPIALGERAVVSATRLALDATESLELRSGATLGLGAEKVKLDAGELGAVARRVDFVAHSLSSSITRVRSFARVVDAVVDQLTQHAKTSLRFVSELDRSRAKHVDQQADETMILRSKHASVLADGITKIDASQVHIG